MFPNFYPVNIRASLSKQMEDTQKYVFGHETSAGEERLAKPVKVCGSDPALLVTLGQDLGKTGVRTVTKGSLNFEEWRPRDQIKAITVDFFEFVYAGIDSAERLYNGVAHEKNIKQSGLRSSDVHFATLDMLAKKERIFRPYYFLADWYGFYLWAEKMNYRYNLTSPYDPAKWRISSPRIYASDTPEVVQVKQEVGALVAAAFQKHELNLAQDVIDFLRECPGIESVERDEKRIIIAHADCERSIALKARIYDPSFEEGTLRERIKNAARITQDDCESEYLKISAAREARHWQRFGEPTLRWTFDPSLCATIISLNLNKHHDYRTTTGRYWGIAIDIDQKFGVTFGRIGAACERLGAHIGQIGVFADVEPQGKDGLLGDDVSVAGEVQERVHLFSSAAEALGGELERSGRLATVYRGSGPSPGELAGIHRGFDGAFRRVGGGFAGSVEEILDFFRGLYGTKKSKRDEKQAEQKVVPPPATAIAGLRFLMRRTELEMVVLAAKKGILSRLPIAVFQNLKVASLDVSLVDGRALADAMAAQLDITVLFQAPQLLIPAIAWHVSAGLTGGPAGVPTLAKAALLSTEALVFRPSSRDLTLAQILANCVEGSEWAAAMCDHAILTLYTEETLEKLNSGVLMLLLPEGRGGKDRIEVKGAVIIRGERGIEALGGLKEVVKRGLTPAAAELRTVIEMANSPEVFRPRLEQTRDDTPHPSPEYTQ